MRKLKLVNGVYVEDTEGETAAPETGPERSPPVATPTSGLAESNKEESVTAGAAAVDRLGG